MESKTLNDGECHLALERPISRVVYIDRERETHLQINIKAKPEHLKLSMTYSSTRP
jgi:hypothetical protein